MTTKASSAEHKMAATPVPSGGSSAFKVVFISAAATCALAVGYEYAAAYYAELSKTKPGLNYDKFPLNAVPSVVWAVCRAVAFVVIGVMIAWKATLASLAASYTQLMKGNNFDLDSAPMPRLPRGPWPRVLTRPECAQSTSSTPPAKIPRPTTRPRSPSCTG